MPIPLCSWDGHFWPRKKHLFYVGWGRGGDMQRYRLRFCPSHVLEVQEYLAKYEVATDGEAARVNWTNFSSCLADGKPADQLSWQVFITGYPAQDQRKDYWAYLHIGCSFPHFLGDSYSDPPKAS